MHAGCVQPVNDAEFVANCDWALRLLVPLKLTIHAAEADQPMLSQCLPMWHSVSKHVNAWVQDQPDKVTLLASAPQKPSVPERVIKRFRKSYIPCMSLAYLLDPAFWVEGGEYGGYKSDEVKLNTMSAGFGVNLLRD